MSNNPFEAPTTKGSNQSLSKSTALRPGAASAVSIICLILGIMGMLGTCVGGAGLIVLFAGILPQEDLPKQSGFELATAGFFMLLNFFVAGVLLYFSIQTLRNQETGRKGLATASLIAAGFVFFRMIAGLISNFLNPPAVPPGIDPNAQLTVSIVMYVTIGLSILFGIGLAVFYIVTNRVMNSDSVVAFYRET